MIEELYEKPPSMGRDICQLRDTGRTPLFPVGLLARHGGLPAWRNYNLLVFFGEQSQYPLMVKSI